MTPGCPSRLTLERHLANERWPESKAVTAHVRGCAPCGRQLEEMKEAGARYSASPAAAALRERLVAREVVQAAPRSPPWWGVVSLALAASLAMFFVPWRAGSPDVMPKGGGLTFVLERDGHQRSWDGQSRLRAGDVVQPMWTSSMPGYLLLLAKGPEGDLQVLFSSDGRAAGQVPGGSEAVLLGSTLHMDGLSKGHDLWAFFSARPFALEGVRDVAQGRTPVQAFDGRTIQLRLPVDVED